MMNFDPLIVLFGECLIAKILEACVKISNLFAMLKRPYRNFLGWFKFLFAFYPQTNGQIEGINHILFDCVVGKNQRFGILFYPFLSLLITIL